MGKPPGVFSLLASAVTGFGSHLVTLWIAGRDRVLGRPNTQKRPRGR